MKKILRTALLNFAILIGAFVVLEGVASGVLFVRGLAKAQLVAERRHTQYDELLGWVNTPHTSIKDMYGPGTWLRINGQGFRNTRDFPRDVPRGKTRVICAGDSFTFGYGVNNEQTWCARLAAKEPRFETVNMGQGGYGIDQAYLWYKRDGRKLEHDLLLFAFITLDFERMQQREFLGYGKPLFTVQNGALTLTNVPVPKSNALIPWLNQRRDAVRGLRSFELLRTLFARRQDAIAESQKPDEPRRFLPEAMAEKIFIELARISRESGSVPVLIYLPFRTAEDDDLRWQRHVHDVAQRHGIALIDLVDLFNGLPLSEVATMFIPEGTLAYRGAAGHYTIKGNELIAAALHERLQQNPQVAANLRELP